MSTELTINNKANIVDKLDQLRINDTTLRADSWQEFDRKVVQISEQELNGIKDLRDNGLVYNMSSLTKIISFFELVGDFGAASVDMFGESVPRFDNLAYAQVGVPIPIIHSAFQMNMRQGDNDEESQRIKRATKSVTNKIESLLFLGDDITVQGHKIYGYTSHPKRQTVALSGANKWADGAGRDIMKDVQIMYSKLHNAKYTKNIYMYVSSNMFTALLEDYTTAGKTGTYFERIKQYGVQEIRSSDVLPDSNVVMVSLTDDVVDLALTRDFQLGKWDSSVMSTEYRVYGIMAPRIKHDKNDNCGIVHGS